MQRTISLLGILLFAPCSHAAVPFAYSVVEPQEVWNGHKPKVIGDFGLTGKAGIGIYFANAGFKLYRYPDFQPFLITSYQQGAGDEDAVVADVNGDGAPDIVVGGANGSYWLQNPLPAGKDPYSSQWQVHRIDSQHTAHDILAADINRDGRIDIATESGIYLQGNTPDQWNFAGVALIRRGLQGTSLANLTGDGFSDIIAPDASGTHLSWFENPLHHGGNPLADTWTEHVIDQSPGFTGEMTSLSFDINLDGRADVAMAPMYNDGNLAWYEAPPDPRASTWIKHVIGPVHYVHQGSLAQGDFDGDGHTDIAFAEQEQSSTKRIGVFYNAGSGSSWQLQVLAATGGHNLKTGPIGGDRYPSLLCANHGYYGASTKVELWRNPTSSGAPVSDEFTSLNSSLWTIENPRGDGTMGVIGNQAQIQVPAGSPHDLWTTNNAVRMVQTVANGDFAVEVKFDSAVNQRYQMQGVVVEEDSSNYLRFETYHDGTNTHLLAAAIVSDQPTIESDTPAPLPPGSTWLRVRRAGDQWMFEVSADGVTFNLAANFFHGLTVSRIGPYAGNNSDSGPAPAFTTVVDYFRALPN
jgi:regulation of enolase protein 1 (concanavalin A-like superfamily)